MRRLEVLCQAFGNYTARHPEARKVKGNFYIEDNGLLTT